jgi:dipeptide transport system substrate-binding protein
MQADFAQIGVKVEIKTLDAAEFTKRTRNGEHTLALMDETGGNGDPDSILNTLLGCGGTQASGRNIARWCYDEYQRQVMQGKAGIGINDRISYYEHAQTLFKKQAPWFTLAYQIQSVPVRKTVQGFKVSPFGRLVFTGVDINK